MQRIMKNIPFRLIVFLFFSLLVISGLSMITISCSGGGSSSDDDNNSNNSSATGIWTVRLTVQIDSCYGETPGTILSDVWNITQSGSEIIIVDTEQDTFNGSIENSVITATYNDVENDGDCILKITSIIKGQIDADNDDHFSGSLSGNITVNNPDDCNMNDCAFMSTFFAERN